MHYTRLLLAMEYQRRDYKEGVYLCQGNDELWEMWNLISDWKNVHRSKWFKENDSNYIY